MASPAERGEAHVSSLPQRSSEFNCLEIRGTWNGDELEPVGLRISLELLSTRSANISLIKTSVRLQSNEWGQGNQSSDSSPQSPLFAFSASESDDGTTFYNSRTPEGDLFTAARESPTSSQDATVSSSLEIVADCGNDEEFEHSSHLFTSQPYLSSGLRLNDCADWNKMQNPGRKRSASDASLTDSGSDSERAKVSGMKPSAECIISDVGDVKSTAGPHKRTQNASEGKEGTLQSPIQSSERNSPRKHSRTLSMIPKPVTQLDKDVERGTVSIPAPNALQDASTAARSKQPTEEKYAPAPTQATMTETFRRKRGDSDIIVTSISEAFPGSFEANEPMAAEVAKCTRSNPDNDFPGSTLGMHDVLDGLRTYSEPEGLKITIDQHVEPTLSHKPHRDMTAPKTPGPEHDDADQALAHGPKYHLACDFEDYQSSMSEPKLDIKDGMLFIRNPKNVRPAIYKFTVTISVLLEKDKSKGWRNLVIPGLPRMRAGESGFFLFQIPENHGLEFRTTNLQRYKIVENCFFAEFVNHGDLVVPLRVCDQKFYGIVKDFTVDQEIRADHQVIASADHEDNGIQADVIIKYIAMCSLRLHNRCFWAEKCCFFLRLDGGPDGRFHCRLEPQETGLQMINLENKGIPVGVSYLQVTCSPKTLDTFGVTWKVKLPGQQAINWLPRIYPVSSTTCESNRNNLRQIFTELEAEYRKEAAPQLAKLVEFDREDVRGQHNADKSEDREEDLIQSGKDFFDGPFPPEAKTQTSIANVVVDSMAYCMQSLIISLCISMIWVILTSYLEIPPCPRVSNYTLSETYTNLTVATSEIIGLAFPSDEDRESQLEPLDNELAPERAIASHTPEIFQQTYMAGVGLNGLESGHADHNETGDIREKVGEDKDTPAANVKSGNSRYEDQPRFSLRDRIDYWLGWMGPVADEL
ncbi:hypothetical protein IFM61606_06732 [Aspergillus udagawae]|uniref:Uncharacterized protein n=1 Tax=Aspergillus udagawae TaxID=91492 RepID=A0ABQ1BAH1_9EURO|nr:hypothetical protein IFM51744_00140 [Aspergillus udagawae]GFF97387.1 hypothetical protein IFM53868_09061 [Aspergillus udagawae]GFG02802.1 hypothetical protein IFM5058_01116 [Aspergillus udagawae]GFG26736.1 hypothetical protein IFM61606_06732 [Aspergillus udagawae]